MIQNSVGTKMYRSNFMINGEGKTDITKDGELSCAFFVSSVLYHFGLLRSLHASVDGTVKDLEMSGWEKVREPKEGSILVWDFETSKNGSHRHVGFYVGGDKAISNSSEKRAPEIHQLTFGEKRGVPVRKIVAMYWKKGLENK